MKLTDEILKLKVPVIIKTCQEFIGEEKKRKGMFRMDEADHGELQVNKGMYLFVVETLKGHTYIRMLPASEVTYKRNLTWSSIMNQTKLGKFL